MQTIYYFLNKEKQEIESTVCVRKLHFTFLYISAYVSSILSPTHKNSLYEMCTLVVLKLECIWLAAGS